MILTLDAEFLERGETRVLRFPDGAEVELPTAFAQPETSSVDRVVMILDALAAHRSVDAAIHLATMFQASQEERADPLLRAMLQGVWPGALQTMVERWLSRGGKVQDRGLVARALAGGL